MKYILMYLGAAVAIVIAQAAVALSVVYIINIFT